MKVIDLLNKIANEEKVPKYINYTHKAFGKDTMMVCKENIINKLDIGAIELNDEVEIIEDKPFNERVEEIYNRHIDYIYDKEDKKIEHIENYVDFVNLNDSEKFDYLYEMETRIIDYINKESK